MLDRRGRSGLDGRRHSRRRSHRSRCGGWWRSLSLRNGWHGGVVLLVCPTVATIAAVTIVPPTSSSAATAAIETTAGARTWVHT